MSTRLKIVLISLAVVGVAFAAVAVGYLVSGPPQRVTSVGGSATVGAVAPSALSSQKEALSSSGGAASAGQDSAATPAPPNTPQTTPVEPLIITTAAMAVMVKDLDPAVAAVRSIAASYGAEIANLSSSQGEGGGIVVPLPQATTGGTTPGPAQAQITLRVPADQLAAVENAVGALGTVLNTSSSSDDVTQQHVDLSARLKNLQAEEARLRTFFTQAKNVTEMLAIDAELSRVRGEIESMQAQLALLERQAARATLTIALTQPAPIVSPGSSTGWGFLEAITAGTRAAASLLRAGITGIIALAPLAVLALLAWAVWRLVRRARRPRPAAVDEPAKTTDAS